MRMRTILRRAAGIAILGFLAGCGERSQPLRIQTPAAPTDLACSLDGRAAVALTWRDNAVNESGFLVERRIGNTGGFASIDSLGPDSEAYLDSGVQPGTLSYRIKAFNQAGVSAPSNIAIIEVLRPVPPVPASFRVTRLGFFSVALAWDDLSDEETGFSLIRSRDDSLHFSAIAALASNTTGFEDTLLDPGTPYFYRLRSFNADGESAYTGTVMGCTRIPSMDILPASIAAGVGDRIGVSLLLTDPMSVFFGISLRITFDPGVCEFVGFGPGVLFGSDAIAFSERRGNTVYIAMSLKRGAPPVAAAGGIGTVTFQAVGPGSTGLSIPQENVRFYDGSGAEFGMPFLRIRGSEIIVQ
jgi:hypothetical protein